MQQSRCVAIGCSEIGVYSFPENPRMRILWENSIKIPDFRATKNSRLCYQHFLKSDFNFHTIAVNKEPVLKMTLKPSAVPSVFKEKTIPNILGKKIPIVKLQRLEILESEKDLDSSRSSTSSEESSTHDVVNEPETVWLDDFSDKSAITEQSKAQSEVVHQTNSFKTPLFKVTSEKNIKSNPVTTIDLTTDTGSGEAKTNSFKLIQLQELTKGYTKKIRNTTVINDYGREEEVTTSLQAVRPVPRAVRPAPQAIRRVLHSVGPVAQVIRPVPQAVRPVPRVFRPAPPVFRPVAQVVRPVAQMVRPVQKAVSPVPHAKITISQTGEVILQDDMTMPQSEGTMPLVANSEPPNPLQNEMLKKPALQHQAVSGQHEHGTILLGPESAAAAAAGSQQVNYYVNRKSQQPTDSQTYQIETKRSKIDVNAALPSSSNMLIPSAGISTPSGFKTILPHLPPKYRQGPHNNTYSNTKTSLALMKANQELVTLKKDLKSITKRYKYLELRYKRERHLTTAFQKVTKNMSTSAKIFTRMQMEPRRTNSTRFSLEEKILALSLYKQSPASYKLLSELFTLPGSGNLKILTRSKDDGHDADDDADERQDSERTTAPHHQYTDSPVSLKSEPTTFTSNTNNHVKLEDQNQIVLHEDDLIMLQEDGTIILQHDGQTLLQGRVHNGESVYQSLLMNGQEVYNMENGVYGTNLKTTKETQEHDEKVGVEYTYGTTDSTYRGRQIHSDLVFPNKQSPRKQVSKIPRKLKRDDYIHKF